MAKTRTEEFTAKVLDAVHDAGDKLTEQVAVAKEAAAPVLEEAREKVTETAEHAKDVISEKVEEGREALAERAEHAADRTQGGAADLKGSAADKAADLKDTASAKAADLKDAATEKAADLKGSAADTAADLRESAADLRDSAVDKAAEAKAATSKVAHQAANTTPHEVRELIENEWLPQLKESLTAATAAGVAAAQNSGLALAGKPRKKRGKVLIAVGLVGLATAGALIVVARRKKAKQAEPKQAAADIAAQVEQTTAKLQNQVTDAGDQLAAKADDAVAGVENSLDSAIDSGAQTTRRARRGK